MPSRPRLLPPPGLLAGVTGGVMVLLLAFVVTVNRTAVSLDSPPPAPPSAASGLVTQPTPSIEDVARAALTRTVTIESLRAGDEGLGTGWLLDGRGDFVTNAHVVDGQQTVRIRSRGGTAHVGRVLGMDRVRDIAVVRSQDGFGVTPLPVRSTRLEPLPQLVVTIASGSATGHADITVEHATMFVASVPVTADTATGQPPSSTGYRDMLVLAGQQIFPGNSGGPVLDQGGTVVGVLTLASRSAPQGYAIPLDRVLAEILSFAAR